MAVFRKIHTSYWQDPFILSLTQEQKMFYLYLLTNAKTTACGIYEISKQLIKLETSLNIKIIDEMLIFFEKEKKIKNSNISSEICITNWFKYNNNISPSTVKATKKSFKLVKDNSLIPFLNDIDEVYTQYYHSVDTIPNLKLKGYGENENEKENQKENEKEREREQETHSQRPIITRERELLQKEFGKKNADKYISKVIYQIKNNNKEYKSIYDTAKLWLIEDDFIIVDQEKRKAAKNENDKLTKDMKEKSDLEFQQKWDNMTPAQKKQMEKTAPGMVEILKGESK